MMTLNTKQNVAGQYTEPACNKNKIALVPSIIKLNETTLRF